MLVACVATERFNLITLWTSSHLPSSYFYSSTRLIEYRYCLRFQGVCAWISKSIFMNEKKTFFLLGIRNACNGFNFVSQKCFYFQFFFFKFMVKKPRREMKIEALMVNYLRGYNELQFYCWFIKQLSRNFRSNGNKKFLVMIC